MRFSGEIESIESFAFFQNKIQELTIKFPISKIGADVFSRNELKKVNILEKIKELDSSAFNYNSDLIIYGEKDSEIEKYAIENNIPFEIYE